MGQARSTRISPRPIMLALALASVACIAWAQQGYVGIAERLTPDQLREVGLTPAQVELLDRYLRASEATRPTTTPRTEPSASTETRRGPAQYIGLDDAPIRSRVKGAVAGWAPGTVFELENGQQWKVLKGSMTLHKVLQSPEILVVPGVAGRWFLQVDEDTPKARVYRID